MPMPSVGGYNPSVNPMGDVTGVSSEEAQKNFLEQAKEMYPRLKNVDYSYLESSPTSKEDFRKLEHWPKGEPGDEKYPRPKELPLDKSGIQVLDKSISPTDVAADIVSHSLVEDKQNHPELYKLNQDFKKTLSTPEAKKSLREFYREDIERGDDRSYKDWLKQTGEATYLRGYLFKQFPESEIPKHYSKKQMNILDNMDKYLRSSDGK
jgi:hypothetical protein